MTILNFIRPDLRTSKRYAPGGQNMLSRLHQNELPWEPQALINTRLNQYPSHGEGQKLTAILASQYQVNHDQLLITRGSDEGIDLLMRLFLTPGADSMMQCPPTFSMYAFFARLQQVNRIDCPLMSDDFRLNLDLIQSAWVSGCKMIMLCRPNNPTGNLLELADVIALCRYFQNKAMIVVDEAYIEFSEVISATSLIERFDNLIILRTLSKAYGLAGLRLGAVIARPELIQALSSIMAPFALSDVVVSLAIRALQDKTWFVEGIQRIVSARASLIHDLQAFPWIEHVYPSAANFILIKTPYTQSLFNWFAQQGIAVRHFDASSDLHHCLRITVSDEVQNEHMMMALKKFRLVDN